MKLRPDCSPVRRGCVCVCVWRFTVCLQHGRRRGKEKTEIGHRKSVLNSLFKINSQFNQRKNAFARFELEVEQLHTPREQGEIKVVDAFAETVVSYSILLKISSLLRLCGVCR